MNIFVSKNYWNRSNKFGIDQIVTQTSIYLNSFCVLSRFLFYATMNRILLYILYLDIVGVLYSIPLKFLIDEFPWKRNAHTMMILVEWVQFYTHNSLLMRWKVLLNANIVYRWLMKKELENNDIYEIITFDDWNKI